MNFLPSSLKKPSAAAAALMVSIGLAFTPAAAQADETHLMLRGEALETTQSALDEIDEALIVLNGTQSQDEINSLIEIGYTHVLVDGDTGEKLAAIHTGPSNALSLFAISQLGPGCSGTSACLTTTGNVNLGFVGTGTKSMNFSDIQRAAAGDTKMSVKTATGAIHHIPAKIMITFLHAQTIKQMTRG